MRLAWADRPFAPTTWVPRSPHLSGDSAIRSGRVAVYPVACVGERPSGPAFLPERSVGLGSFLPVGAEIREREIDVLAEGPQDADPQRGVPAQRFAAPPALEAEADDVAMDVGVERLHVAEALEVRGRGLQVALLTGDRDQRAQAVGGQAPHEVALGDGPVGVGLVGQEVAAVQG